MEPYSYACVRRTLQIRRKRHATVDDTTYCHCLTVQSLRSVILTALGLVDTIHTWCRRKIHVLGCRNCSLALQLIDFSECGDDISACSFFRSVSLPVISPPLLFISELLEARRSGSRTFQISQNQEISERADLTTSMTPPPNMLYIVLYYPNTQFTSTTMSMSVPKAGPHLTLRARAANEVQTDPAAPFHCSHPCSIPEAGSPCGLSPSNPCQFPDPNLKRPTSTMDELSIGLITIYALTVPTDLRQSKPLLQSLSTPDKSGSQ